MPYRPILLTVLSLTVLLHVFAQPLPHGVIRLRTGTLPIEKNIDTLSIARLEATRRLVMERSFHFIRFDHLPSPAERTALAIAGVDLLDYIPDDLYVAEVRRTDALPLLKKLGAQDIRELAPEHKIAPGNWKSIKTETVEPGANDRIEALLLLFPSIPVDTAIALLNANDHPNISILPDRYKSLHVLTIRCRQSDLTSLASLPFVRYIDHPFATSYALTTHSPYSHDDEKANVLQAGLPEGYNLTGQNVSVGIFELAGLPQRHIDFADRITPLTTLGLDDSHSTLVNGLAGGAGLIDERYIGYAPRASLLCNGPGFLINVPAGLVLTNNSYATGEPCDSFGPGLVGGFVDQQAIDYPSLLDVFAAGNSGSMACSVYPPGFHTILSGEQSAKSTLSVGETLASGSLDNSSSRGPTADGRIKPEIVATGIFVTSTYPVNTYQSASGTSISAPAVTGGLALLYQEYRRLHGGSDPSSGLMKAIICNTANDLGNPGPDYSYGFGRMNLLRAVRLLDSAHYFSGAARQAAVDASNIIIPANTAQLKVFLYWQDPAASPFAPLALVNDLDLQVIGPDGATTLPYILDTLPANVTNPATRGEDHVNNMEQVVIDNPRAGVYTIKIKGTRIAQNNQQDYIVTYDPVPSEVDLTYPFAGARLVPGETSTIQWDSWGSNGSTYSLQFSPDNGISWQSIATAIGAGQRQYAWTVPATATEKALVKIKRDSDGATCATGSFIVAGVPAISLDSGQCPGTISVDWPAVTGATDYEAMIIRGGAMVSIDTVTATQYRFRDLSPDSSYWVTIRSRIHGVPGRRAVALNRQPSDGDCPDPIYSGDLSADSLIAPATGRQFTSSALGAQDTIRLRIKNLSASPVSNYTLQYRINGGPWISDIVTTGIAPRSTLIHSFTLPYNFSATGNYSLTLVVTNPADAFRQNDTLHVLIRHLANPPLTPRSSIADDFAQTPDTVYAHSLSGIIGADRFDYTASSPDGRLYTTTDQLGGSNSRVVLLNYAYTIPFAVPTNYLTATYNLSGFDTATNTVGLVFTYAKKSSDLIGDTLSIRGSDTQPWIRIFDPTRMDTGSVTGSVRFADLATHLKTAGQNFSSSFQVQWPQVSDIYSLNKISLYDETNDAELMHIDSLSFNSCNLGKAVPINVTIRNNTAKTITGLPVGYSIDGGAMITETVNTVPAGDSLSFTFFQRADLSAPGLHTISASVALPGDDYDDNNLQTIQIRNQPLISQFPYLEDFETGDGNWYTTGHNDSWAYGTPSSTVIDRAASGSKAWKTNLTGSFNAFQNGYILSPFFDLSGLSDAALSASIAVNTDSCGNPVTCDFLQIQYSVDSGAHWLALPLDSAFNWATFITSVSQYHWHVASDLLPPGLGIVQFRIWFHSNGFHSLDGIAVDDIHIYGNALPIYDPPAGNVVGALQKMIPAGNQWIDFVRDGQIIASIRPNGQDLGSVTLEPFIHEGAARNFHGQYYLDRNFVISSSTNSLTGPVAIRLYFLDREKNAMLADSRCTVCSKPIDAYRLGISAYSTDSLKEENDSVQDDLAGSWSFLDSTQVHIVPYGNGYYAEFTTSRLSEFWLNDGGDDGESPLPVQFLNTAAKQRSPSGADLSWSTASEIDIDHFDLQRADGDAAYKQGDFVFLGSVNSRGASRQQQDYRYADTTGGSATNHYYRIKGVDAFGNYSYSKTIAVQGGDVPKWQFYPNPSSGLYTLTYQLGNGQIAEMNIYNSLGTLTAIQSLTGTGSPASATLDLRSKRYPAGIYFVKILSPVNTTLKVIKY